LVRVQIWVSASTFLDASFPNPAQFSRVTDLPRTALTICARDPSLRLKNGYGQDDAAQVKDPHVRPVRLLR